ncbi:hypothetical protein NEOLEDRAFT_1194323 [Neolentinus lepideus HHB14362 ss-1]|uniref:Uncharacterized protein n=1 Tax=Neolentinus lepideus HHB14362 ss-1 TaxID=1314782 RepID=A0A165TPK8_9AGAM|nr:hypothetical protein NEOLEDRAFT_1194323 [Neolentinus lepideus HHB14362 ss-1]
MTTLPSFVELMASLGLENNIDRGSDLSYPRLLRPSSSHPQLPSAPRTLSGPASTPSMPTIMTSDHDAPSSKNGDLDTFHLGSGQRIRRYAPYSPRIDEVLVNHATQSHVRNKSVPAPFSDGVARGPGRPVSTSPRLAEARDRPAPLALNEGSRRRASTLHSETIAGTPISTYLRRKTPSASPTSPHFPHRSVRTPPADPAAPVSLPSLPPLPPMSYTYVSASTHSATPAPRSGSASPPSPDWHKSGIDLNPYRSRHVSPVA